MQYQQLIENTLNDDTLTTTFFLLLNTANLKLFGLTPLHSIEYLKETVFLRDFKMFTYLFILK